MRGGSAKQCHSGCGQPDAASRPGRRRPGWLHFVQLAVHTRWLSVAQLVVNHLHQLNGGHLSVVAAAGLDLSLHAAVAAVAVAVAGGHLRGWKEAAGRGVCVAAEGA